MGVEFYQSSDDDGVKESSHAHKQRRGAHVKLHPKLKDKDSEDEDEDEDEEALRLSVPQSSDHKSTW